jgi:hypothetical protein
MLVGVVVPTPGCYATSPLRAGFQDVAAPLWCAEIGNITTNYAMVYFPNLNCIKYIPPQNQKR